MKLFSFASLKGGLMYVAQDFGGRRQSPEPNAGEGESGR